MAKELICPHCKKGISAGGFECDENLNMLCGLCKGVVFAAVKETEAKVKHLLVKPPDHTQTWQQQQKKDCLPIRMQPSSNINSSSSSSLYSGFDFYGD